MEPKTSDKICPKCKNLMTYVVSGTGQKESVTKLVCPRCGNVESPMNESLKRKLND